MNRIRTAILADAAPVSDRDGDAEWVADLFDTFKAGDLDVTVDELDVLLGTLRRAAKARRALTLIQPALLRRGLQVRAARSEVRPCR